MIYILPTDTCFGMACGIDDTNSYNKIYALKKREFEKPLAIMVDSFFWLEKNTILNNPQITELKNLKEPFTILTECSVIKLLLNFNDGEFQYENKEYYEKIAFRVANNKYEKELVKNIGPIFLTSANFSGEKEIYNINELKEKFKFEKNIMYLGEDFLYKEKRKPSSIFYFLNETTEKIYKRK